MEAMNFNRDNRLRLVFFLLVSFICLTLTFFITPTPAFACIPTEFKTYTVADHVKAAQVVLEGTVTAELPQQKIPVQIPGLNNFISTDEVRVVSVKVQRYFKGNGPATVTISGFGEGGDCLSLVLPKEHLIFYTSGSTDKGLVASYLLVSDATADAKETTISEIIATTRQNPTLPTEISSSLTATPTQPTNLIPTSNIAKPNQTSITHGGSTILIWLFLGLVIVAFGVGTVILKLKAR